MVAEEYRFDDSADASPKKNGDGIGKFIWNSETKEFLGRDGGSWAKITLFYAIFYACLGSFFVGLLSAFTSFMPADRPSYYGEASTMNIRGLNPGLGFRPQIDVEDSSIIFNPQIAENVDLGYKKYVQNLQHFLDAKYGKQDEVFKCENGKSYVDELKSGKSCEFDHKTLFENTECNAEKAYGFRSSSPCILLKMNKIMDWIPQSENSTVVIKCDGETSADKDNLRKTIYHSENDLNNTLHGSIQVKHFPFFVQKSYRAPFVWAQFEIPANTLVNIECRAYANNIDNVDRLNRRGQTKFSLFIAS